MIGKLSGKIDSVHSDHVIIDVGGVGYLTYCSGKTMTRLNAGDHAQLLIETHVREDHIRLYGFYSHEEKATFNVLQSVKGVGTRMSMAILSTMSPEEVQIALSSRDIAAFNQVSGVGKKLAERIITELKDKFVTDLSGHASSITNTAKFGVASNSSNDAISALVNLGINKIDAQNRIARILAEDENISISELIKLALKHGA